MASKEALEIIKKYDDFVMARYLMNGVLSPQTIGSPSKVEFDEAVKTIEKDLDLLEQYKKIEEELGIDLIEAKYVLDNASMTVGYTRDGKPIHTDYGYIEDFIDELREALKK